MAGGLVAPMHERRDRYPTWEAWSLAPLLAALESALAGEAAALERVAELEALLPPSDREYTCPPLKERA